MGPSLGVNKKWTKRSDHDAQKIKWMCCFFLNICPEGQFWDSIFMFYLLPFFSPYFLLTIVTFGPSEKVTKNNNISLLLSLDFCNKRTSFASLTAKPIRP